MKIGINITALQNSLRFRGPGTYFIQLMKVLLRKPDRHEFIAFYYNERLGVKPHVLSDPEGVSIPDTNNRLPRTSIFTMQCLLPLQVWRSNITLLHEPMQFAALWQPVPTIITIHDLASRIYPEYTSSKLKMLDRIYQKAAHKAKRVITVSEASKRDLINYLNLPTDKIRVTYLGVAGNFFRVEDGQLITDTLRRFKISDKYILYVGGTHAHKNILDLLDTFYIFHKNFPKIKLVIAGKSAQESTEINQWIQDKKMKEYVIRLGFLTEEELRVLYSGGLFHISLSLYEGFGLTFLEAMSCGTAVIGYRAGSIAEVVGDAGLLLPPRDRKAVLQAMGNLVENGPLRQELREKGYQQAQKFSWDACAKATIDVYEEVSDELNLSRAR